MLKPKMGEFFFQLEADSFCEEATVRATLNECYCATEKNDEANNNQRTLNRRRMKTPVRKTCDII